MTRKLVGLVACCALGGCARLMDSRSEAGFQVLARPGDVFATVEADLVARGYTTHQVQGRWLSGRQSEATPMAYPAMAVAIVLLPVSIVTWPVVLLVAAPISPEFAAWWPVYPLSIPDGATIHRNIQVSAEAGNAGWTLVRMTAKADRRGIRDFKAVHELLLRTYPTCDAPVLGEGASAPRTEPADSTR